MLAALVLVVLAVAVLPAARVAAGGPGRGHAKVVGSSTEKHSNYFPKDAKNQFREKLKNSVGEIKPEDTEFYYFSSFDKNADEHLDGNELRDAFLQYDYDEPTTLAEIEEIVDGILEEDDHDNDGRISWAEYLASESIHEHLGED
ncbi:hypothetical protein H9P43_003185 [Blastocladiella emersonii ATCC 22665]|nr:hypothetical protein H9P43_003185 [Blastocladiella emersonii ATCC 22665]